MKYKGLNYESSSNSKLLISFIILTSYFAAYLRTFLK